MPTIYSLTPPDRGATCEVSTRPNQSTLGGFRQATLDGLNGVFETWSLKWSNKTKTVAGTILAFLEERSADKGFYWVTPLGDSKRFVCTKFSYEANNDMDWTVSAEWVEDFNMEP